MKPKFAIPGWIVQRSDSRDIRQLLNFIEFCNGLLTAPDSADEPTSAFRRQAEPLNSQFRAVPVTQTGQERKVYQRTMIGSCGFISLNWPFSPSLKISSSRCGSFKHNDTHSQSDNALSVWDG